MDNSNKKHTSKYTRVSTGRQENEKTIDSQKAEIDDKSKLDKRIVLPQYDFSDDGWPSTILARPGLDALRDEVKRGEIDTIYVYDLGRLSRVFYLQLFLLREFEEAGVNVISLHDVNPENPEEEFLRNIMGIFHDFERIKIAERFRRGKLYKAKNGMLINGQALYGYKYIKKTDSKPPKYLVNAKEAEAVKMIHNWFGNERVSIKGIVRKLYEKGILPRKNKSEFWSTGPLLRLLRCESYITGLIYYNKSEAVPTKNPRKEVKYKKIAKGSRRVRPREEWYKYEVTPILDDWELFNKVQKILDNNRRHGPRKKGYDYLLSGLVYCECGYRRAGNGKNNGHNYYRCTERVLKSPLPHECKSPALNAQVLDKVFCNELGAYLTDPTNINKIAEDYLKAQAIDESEDRERQKLHESITKLKEEEARYIKAYGEAEIDFEQFKEMKRGVNKRIKALEDDLIRLNEQVKDINIDNVELKEFCQEVKEVLGSLNYPTKSLLIQDLIDKIVLKGYKNEVDVYGYLSVAHLNMGYGTTNRNRWVTK